MRNVQVECLTLNAINSAVFFLRGFRWQLVDIGWLEETESISGYHRLFREIGLHHIDRIEYCSFVSFRDLVLSERIRSLRLFGPSLRVVESLSLSLNLFFITDEFLSL